MDRQQFSSSETVLLIAYNITRYLSALALQVCTSGNICDAILAKGGFTRAALGYNVQIGPDHRGFTDKLNNGGFTSSTPTIYRYK
jgi:hypothetical protein